MVKKNKKIFLIIGIILVLVIVVGLFFYLNYEEDAFSINPDSPIKMNINLGSEAISTLKIKNNENTICNFSLELQGLENISSLSKTNFQLEPRESKEIKISFRNGNETNFYIGKLIIKNSFLTKEIPIFILFEDSHHMFTIIQEFLPKYANPYPGGELGVDINVYDLSSNTFLREAKASYVVKNFEGETIISEEGKIVIENQHSYSKFFDVPKKLPYGKYILITEIDYQGLRSISGYLFEVDEKRTTFIPEDFNFFVILIFVFIIIVLFLFFYFIRTRDALLVELKRQQSRELRYNLDLVSRSQKALKKLEKVPEKEKKIAKLEETKKTIGERFKKKHEEERKELKKIKKKAKKKSYVQQKVEDWKKQGYKMPWTSEQIKKASGETIAKKLKEWKKQGFDTSVLNK